MSEINRRKFLELAASFGAVLAWSSPSIGSVSGWSERRDAYPQGVASADPHPDSVMLWTRRPPLDGKAARRLSVEVADDSAFRRVIARTVAKIGAETDWTCRVLAAGLKPGRVYWYHRSHDHCTFQHRHSAGAVRVCELPKRTAGRLQCLSSNDL
jgi:alkaline phosphatase D